MSPTVVQGEKYKVLEVEMHYIAAELGRGNWKQGRSTGAVWCTKGCVPRNARKKRGTYDKAEEISWAEVGIKGRGKGSRAGCRDIKIPLCLFLTQHSTADSTVYGAAGTLKTSMIRRKNIKYELCDDAMPRLIAMCIFLQNNFDQNSTCTFFCGTYACCTLETIYIWREKRGQGSFQNIF